MRKAALAFGLFLAPVAGWAAYNEIPPGVLTVAGLNAAGGAVGVTGLGTNVLAALQTTLDAAGGVVGYSQVVADIQAQSNPFLVTGGPLGTPSSGVMTNLTGTPASIGLVSGTGLPLAGVTGLGTNVFTTLSNAANGANGLLQLNGLGTVPQAALTTRASAASVVAAPVAPASTSVFAMQGLAGTITPATTGRIWITISGTIVAPSSTVVDNGISYQISIGTGTAPINAATLTGTQVGSVQTYTSPTAPTAIGDVHTPFSITYIVSGLTVGTPVWIDLAAESVTTASSRGLAAVSVVAVEF
jgi:hypothetical protein